MLEEELEEVQDAEEEESAAFTYIKMDYSLESPLERKAKVEEIIANTPPERLTPRYLEKLADYIIFSMDKEERKNKKILTDNRMVTVNKRETSFEGLVGKLENGEDGIYNMIANDKNIIFQPKVSITEEDLAAMPALRELYEAIQEVEKASKNARGARAYALKRQLIEMRKDQYIIKASYNQPAKSVNLIKSFSKIDFDENITINAAGEVVSDGIVNFFNEKHVSALLCNYKKLKEDTKDKLNSDAKWMMEDFGALVERTLGGGKFPIYYDIVKFKIDNLSNAEIQLLIEQEYGVKHSVEYISSLWRNKIPKLIAQQATNEYLIWHYTNVEKGQWKKCTRCGQIKLAHNNFFSKNKTSKDGYYSICKECRNKK